MPRGTRCTVPVIALVLVLVTAGCVPLEPPTEAPRVEYHFVRQGENLYRIALEYGLDYRDLAAWNSIPEPYVIYPGQRLAVRRWARRTHPADAPIVPASSGTGVAVQTLPPPPVFTAAPPAVGATGARAPIATAPQAPAGLPGPSVAPAGSAAREPGANAGVSGTSVRPVPALTGPPPAPPGNGRWRWPARGRMARAFAAGHGGNKGLDIVGAHGAPVYAAGDGIVVYAGDGLRQYGNLIIIKHDADYLSAYGYLSRTQVAEGEHVRAGQPIAQMGGNAGVPGVLHFEIRRRGTPVNPASLLGPAPP